MIPTSSNFVSSHSECQFCATKRGYNYINICASLNWETSFKKNEPLCQEISPLQKTKYDHIFLTAINFSKRVKTLMLSIILCLFSFSSSSFIPVASSSHSKTTSSYSNKKSWYRFTGQRFYCMGAIY